LSQADSAKWDARYRDGAYTNRRHPTPLLARFAPELKRGTALDIACGAGRNALFLAESGFDVDAVDISGAGLERLERDAKAAGLHIRSFEADLESGFPESLGIRDCYDLIVMVRYVNLPLIGAVANRLADGGVFLCEQHLKTHEVVVGPRSEAWRLDPNALLDAARDLRIHFFREGIVTDPDGKRAALTQLVASRGEAGPFVA
jgi:tellurite methyltransferase